MTLTLLSALWHTFLVVMNVVTLFGFLTGRLVWLSKEMAAIVRQAKRQSDE